MENVLCAGIVVCFILTERERERRERGDTMLVMVFLLSLSC